MSRIWFIRAFLGLIIAAIFAASVRPATVAAAPPSPSPSPTAVPTPYMALDQIPNGTWDIIMQGRNITYSTMKLTGVGTSITGLWLFDKKKTYTIHGTRDGSHLRLDVKTSDKSDAPSIGKIDATIDGIADMFGTITIGDMDTPFQGAQHSRVPQPIETSGPEPTSTPF